MFVLDDVALRAASQMNTHLIKQAHRMTTCHIVIQCACIGRKYTHRYGVFVMQHAFTSESICANIVVKTTHQK
jgi:hypothetical protein